MSYDCTNFLGQRTQAMLASTSKGFAVVQPAPLIRARALFCSIAGMLRAVATWPRSRCHGVPPAVCNTVHHVLSLALWYPTMWTRSDCAHFHSWKQRSAQVARISLGRAPLHETAEVHGESACLGSNSPERLTTKMFGRTHAIVTIADAIL